VYEHRIDPVKAQAAYDLILDALIVADLNRAEAAVGLLTVLATQYNGGVLEPEEMRKFTQEASDWLNAYFAKGMKQ
jgi:hypothetical protein